MNVAKGELMEFHAQDDTRLLSPAETAQFLGTTPGTLAAWRCTRKYDLAWIKIGSKVKYRLSDLHAWVARRAVNLPQSETPRRGRGRAPSRAGPLLGSESKNHVGISNTKRDVR